MTDDIDLRSRMQELSDRAEILDCMHRYARGMHYLMNHSVDIDGEVAHAETYYLFIGTDRDTKPLIVSGGRYVDRLERRKGRWAIAARVCLVEWQSEAASLLTPEAIEFLAPIQTVARDRLDTSYQRPLTVKRAAAAAP